MLKIYDNIRDIDFRQLMDVYLESICDNGWRAYPNLSENLQMLYAEQDFYTFLDSFFDEKSARYYVWCDDARYVSALRLESYCDGLLLEALETAPNDRGRGYATALIRAVLMRISSAGHGRIYSHVSRENPISLAIHRSNGFYVHTEYATFIDGTVHPECNTMLYEW